jgi:hypothetical protein
VNYLLVKAQQRLNNSHIVRLAWNNFKFIDVIENTLEKTAYLLE